jgi:hypothetical protein
LAPSKIDCPKNPVLIFSCVSGFEFTLTVGVFCVPLEMLIYSLAGIQFPLETFYSKNESRQSVDSGRWRSGFRNDVDQDYEVMPITIPTRCRSQIATASEW